jgi:hypothetical protein
MTIADKKHTIKDFKLWHQWYEEAKCGLLKNKGVKSKVLVLDMDEVLIGPSSALNEDSLFVDTFFYIVFRKGLKEFVNTMFDLYKDVVIFTCATKGYAESAVRHIEKLVGRSIKHYNRNTALFNGRKYKKRLAILEEFTNADDILIIDDQPRFAFPDEVDNMLHVEAMRNGPSDLNYLVPLLEHFSVVESISKEMQRFKKIWNDGGFLEICDNETF